MKIHKYAVVIIFSLSLSIEGINITERSVQEGETFIFHLPNVDTSNISSVEWKQMERKKLLACISLDNANNTVIFWQRSRLKFMQNGSIVIGDVKQEDTGNYTYNIVYKDGNIQTRIISLTLYSENPEQSRTHNHTSTTSGLPALYILQIVIPVVGGFLLLVSVIVIILKCRRKCFTQDEQIYVNTSGRRKQSLQTCHKKATRNQKQIK